MTSSWIDLYLSWSLPELTSIWFDLYLNWPLSDLTSTCFSWALLLQMAYFPYSSDSNGCPPRGSHRTHIYKNARFKTTREETTLVKRRTAGWPIKPWNCKTIVGLNLWFQIFQWTLNTSIVQFIPTDFSIIKMIVKPLVTTFDKYQISWMLYLSFFFIFSYLTWDLDNVGRSINLKLAS